MRTRPVTLAAAGWLLAGAAQAAPIGPANYDFATFGAPALTHDPAHYGGWTQVLGDHDGDRRVDRLVYAIDAASWRTWTSRANGDGTFAAAVPWQAPGNWTGWTFSTTDVDGDGAQDVVLSRNDADRARSFVARSLHNGTFATPVGWERAGAFGGWTTMFADFTGDQHADLLLCRADATGWHIALAAGDGTGGFGDLISTTFVNQFGGWHLGVGDFNGDGRIDLSLDAHDAGSWRAWVAVAAGDRSFAAPISWASPGNYAGLAEARGDFDADGRTDLLVWAFDATSARAYVARSDGAGAFASPVAWVAAPAGPGWALAIADVNGDGGSDLVLQHPDATGWQVRVAVASGGGAFFPPRPWGALALHFGGWAPAVADVSGDGRADVLVHAVDAVGWRAHVALARGCQDVLAPSDDIAARLAAIAPSSDRQTICFAPGLYERELLIASKTNLSLVAAHGDATIATQSYGFAPFATRGQDPGAPVQIWNSHGVELDGFEIRNRFTYQRIPGPDGELDQTQMVSRAVEIFDSTDVKLANNHLIGPGKQLLHVDHSTGTLVEASQLDCYYFCVDARTSTIELRRSTLRAQHENPADVHALLWTDHSSQRYLNCSMNMVSGKSLFGGVNDFATDALELAGITEVTPSAQAWVSQHPNYNGINLVIRGSYPALADWYFINFMTPGWQAQSQICYDPGTPSAHCVSHFE